MSRRDDWTTALEDMLSEINYSVYIRTGTDTVKRRTTNARTATSIPISSYQTNVTPFVNTTIENTYFKTRYSHFSTWINNLNYSNYPDEKKNGFATAIRRYLELADNNRYNFKVLDQQIIKDFNEYNTKVSASNADAYLRGYYDALTIIKKVLYQSKLMRFQELTNKTR